MGLIINSIDDNTVSPFGTKSSAFDLPASERGNHIHVSLIHVIARTSLKANHDGIG